jgi:hypothetical protein
MKIDMKNTVFILCIALLAACSSTTENLVTKTYEQDNKKFIVQKMPADFNDGASEKETGLQYYRVIIETPEKLRDSSDVSYVNFGLEQNLFMVKRKDSIAPAFMQRISNGKETQYEYIVAFAEEASTTNDYEIYMNDHVFGLGKVSVKF